MNDERGTMKSHNSRRTLFGILCLLFVVYGSMTPAHAQFYNTGTEPPGVRWRQIRTDKFTIIYPQEADSLAQRYAWLFDRSYRAVAAPMRTDLQRLPVVLHPYNLNSNGVVVWAPKRMELYIAPSTSGYAQMWDKQLVAHETRHVAQMNKLNTGFFRFLSYIIGEQSAGVGSGIYLYGWFLEGDAVVSETAVSNTGRGRQPEFLMPMKAYALTGRRFSWDTWLGGSYKYAIPNEYPLGYALASYAYRQAGSAIFSDMLEYITHHPLHIPPGSHALKKYGGFNDRELFAQSFDYLHRQWAKDDSAKTPDPNIREFLFPETETYRSYRAMVAIDTHTVAAVRTDLAQPARLVTVDNDGHETHLCYLGQINSTLKRSGDRLFWTVTLPHERWEQVSFSALQSYHLKTKKRETLTRRTRYFAPAASPDYNWIAVAESNARGDYFLTLLNTHDYRPERRFAVPSGYVPKILVWSDDNTKIYSSLLSDDGLGVYGFDLARGVWEPLLPPGNVSINRLSKYKNYLLFGSGYSGTNNIYAFDTLTRKIFQVTDVRFGAFDPTVSAGNRRLWFANYTPAGYAVATLPLDETTWTETPFDAPATFDAADSIAAQAGFNIDTLAVPTEPQYESRRYYGLPHLFRIHSWAPFFYNPDELRSAALDNDILQYIGLGATLLSQNTLGTLTSRLGYKYSNGFHSGHLYFLYRGWYPVISFSMDVNERHRTLNRYITETDTATNRTSVFAAYMPLSQPSVDASLRVYIPWRFARGGWHTSVQPVVQYQFSNDEYYAMSESLFRYRQSLSLSLTVSQQLAMALRDIYPRWGYAFRAQYSFPVFNTSLYPVWSLQASGYAPGLMASHGLLLSAGYQRRETGTELRYGTFVPLRFPRGYTTVASLELANATLDYTFPVWYPDINISWLAYFKRVRMTLFGDFARVTLPAHMRLDRQWRVSSSSQSWNLYSAGVDLAVDYRVFRFGAPVATGLRLAKPLATATPFPAQSWQVNVWCNVNF
ncbi:MAG: hypothetical protein LBS12_06705 [Prevotellaceae bacterium]|jgi:hypothetical protein|nr:hypothetical protein [Prevotellaceae bacterium]